MADVRPFRALRPAGDLVADVIAPPYDVLTEAEAREIAKNPLSFVHITRPEVDLPDGADPHSDEAYQRARHNLDAFVASGTLRMDAEPTYYFYGQVMGEHRQIGILAGASVAEYDDDLIKKHEETRPDKEDDRTHHMEVLDAQVGLVFLAYRATPRLKALTAELTSGPPAWRVVTEDGVEHALWPAPIGRVQELQQAFGELPALYIADGHHRSAAASRVHARVGSSQTAHFLAGLFPDDALHVMAYNRVVHTLGGRTPSELLHALAVDFVVTPSASAVPDRRGVMTAYLDGSWHRLEPRAGRVPDDPVGCLDVSVLQERVLAPLLGIHDPRRSKDITFVGGIRGASALVEAADATGGIAFCMYPTGLDQLFAVADAGRMMPPKSTWFEPKLREGVVSKLLSG
jgi:uncharacterized protein (DUF1015 family)